MDEVHAFDMSRFQRLICVEGGLVTGTFWVASARNGDFHVKPGEVTLWDSIDHRAGRLLYSTDLIAFVKEGQVDVPTHMVSENKCADVEYAMPALVEAIRLACETFTSTSRAEGEDHD